MKEGHDLAIYIRERERERNIREERKILSLHTFTCLVAHKSTQLQTIARRLLMRTRERNSRERQRGRGRERNVREGEGEEEGGKHRTLINIIVK